MDKKSDFSSSSNTYTHDHTMIHDHDSSRCNFCCTKITDINLKYGTNIILKNINFHVHCGELLTIIGPNGAGKTSLLKCILNEINSTAGHVSFKSKHTLKDKLTIGYVPQRLDINTSSCSVFDFIATYTSSTPIFLYKSSKLYSRIYEHLKDIGSSHLIDKKMSDLSGGELQRVLLTVATIPYPELLILDEFSSGIDLQGKETFFNLLVDIKTKKDIAIIMVCHDFNYVKKYSDRVILLDKTILKEGTFDEVSNSQEFKSIFGPLN